VWRVRISLFWCSCLGNLPSTNTCVTHTLSVDYLPMCPSVKMALCPVPGPEASPVKLSCQSPASLWQEAAPSGDPSPHLPFIRLRLLANFWLPSLIPG
jgi:hypothetical protein